MLKKNLIPKQRERKYPQKTFSSVFLSFLRNRRIFDLQFLLFRNYEHDHPTEHPHPKSPNTKLSCRRFLSRNFGKTSARDFCTRLQRLQRLGRMEFDGGEICKSRFFLREIQLFPQRNDD